MFGPARSQTTRSYDDVVLPVLLECEERLDERLTLEDLAAVAGFSPYHAERTAALWAMASCATVRLRNGAGRTPSLVNEERTVHIANPAEPNARITSRRSLLTAGAWAAPALLLTAATPAASASPAVSALAFKGLGVDFESDQYPYYTVDIQLRLDGTWGGDYRAVTAVTVLLEFEPGDAPFVFDTKAYGDGWGDPVLNNNTVSLAWAGSAIYAGTNTNQTSPIHFKVKGTSATHLTSFTATAASADAVPVVASNQAVTGF